MTSRSGTDRLARFVADLDLDDVPRHVVEHAKSSVLDTLGCALHGSTLPWSRILRDVAVTEGPGDESAVWGTGLRSTRSHAAWLNASAAHGFELDEVHMTAMCHPGSLTLPASAAVGERIGAHGRTVLAGTIAGCEVAARVGSAVGTAHFRQGFHPQGTIGVFAATAAAARVAGLDGETVSQAFGIAASHAAGLMGAQRGAMVKRLHGGHAAQSGVVATLLAGGGFTGTGDVFDIEFGGFCSTMGGGPTHVEEIDDALGERWESMNVAFKQYPSCAAAQASIEAARLLRERHSIAAHSVERVRVEASEHVRAHSGWRYRPEGVTAAQMNIGYGIARMLLDGCLEARHFEERATADPVVVALARKVEVVGCPDIDSLGPDRRYHARVTIAMAGGDEVHHVIEDRPGNVSNPLSADELETKFLGLASPVIGERSSRRIVDAVARLDEVDDIRTLLELLRPDPSDDGVVLTA